MNFKIPALAGILVLSVVFSPALFATNGMYLIGFGTASRAMGGTAYALAEDSLVAAVNPAGISSVDVQAMRVDGNLMLFSPDRLAACCNAPEGEVSGATLYGIPSMGMTMKFNRDLTVGMAFVGAGGGGTRYNFNFFGGDGTLGVTLFQAVMSPTVSYRIKKNHFVGISPLFGIQQFRASGLQPFIQFSADKENVTNRGNDWAVGMGGRLGYQGHFFDGMVSFGAAYSSRIYMTKFDKYKGLFAEEGSLDAPENFGAGIAVRPTKALTIAFDWQRYMYSDVASIGNRSLPISAAGNDPRNLGRDDGPGFGWTDQDVFKAGLQYEINPKWTVRAGYNYGESPIPTRSGGGELEFNVLAPATVEHHFTLGGSYKYTRSLEFSFDWMYAPKNKQSAFIPGGTGLPFENQNIEIEMRQYALEFGVAYKL